MTWNYSGNPSDSVLMEVRFLAGDTNIHDQLIQDEEILYCTDMWSDPILAAALACFTLATKFARKADASMGDQQESASQRSKQFMELAKELDKDGITRGVGHNVLPSFGGLTLSGKDALDADIDATQPAFKRSRDEIPVMPRDGGNMNPLIRHS